MKASIKTLFKTKLFSQSVIYMGGTVLFSIGNYIFHFIVARFLDIKSYGEFAALMSTFTILAIPLATLGIIINKYVSALKGRNKLNEVRTFIVLLTGKFIKITSLFLIIFLIISPFIKAFLKIETSLPVYILGFTISIGFFTQINKSTLQGLQKFSKFTILGIIEVFIKILLGIVFLYLGFQVSGAIGALLGMGIIGYFISWTMLKFLPKNKGKLSITRRNIFKFGIPALIITGSLTTLFNIDVILVKHFFSPENAGYYSIISLLGKILFFGSTMFAGIMFPVCAELYEKKGNHLKIFAFAAAFTLLVSICVILIFIFFPKEIVTLLFGEKFLPAAKYLIPIGIAMTLFSLVHISSQYLLSINKTFVAYILLTGLIFEGIAISAYHPSIEAIITILGVIFGVILISNITYLRLSMINSPKTK